MQSRGEHGVGVNTIKGKYMSQKNDVGLTERGMGKQSKREELPPQKNIQQWFESQSKSSRGVASGFSAVSSIKVVLMASEVP